MRFWEKIGYIVMIYGLAIIIGFGIWLFKSYHESKVYNRLTSSQTTMYDAMFVQLRVIEPLSKQRQESEQHITHKAD